MAVTTANLVQGPAELYAGVFGATEPGEATVNSTPAASAWSDLGGTDGGARLNVALTYSVLTVDQLVEAAGRRLTNRDCNIATSLAEPTLENVDRMLNGGTSASGSGWKSWAPASESSATQPNYWAVLLHGWAPAGNRRMVIGRKVLNIANMESAYTKDGKTLVPVDLATHYVSQSVPSFRVIDGTD
ncbi:hypothetical protein [Saccharothrix xinjiangensis]|uniref:Uncharacterized protein n=1 Tax=Saccharothrix xinjiangensis TaxID=204798 RepID=A0ABV9XW05_9PSEU